MEPSVHHHPHTAHAQHHHHAHHHSSSTPNNTTAASAGGGGGAGSGKFSNDNDSECSSVTSDSIPPGYDVTSRMCGRLSNERPFRRSGKSNAELHRYSGVLKTILTELQERREDCDKMREKVERLEVCARMCLPVSV